MRTLTSIAAISVLLCGCGPAKVNPAQPEDASNKPKHVDAPFKTIEAGNGYGAAMISVDGRRLCVTTDVAQFDVEFQVYDVETSRKIASSKIYTSTKVASSDSANLAAYCNCQRPYALILVDRTTGAEKLRIQPDKYRLTDYVSSIYFSPNGEVIAVASKFGIAGFNTKTGDPVFQIPTDYEHAKIAGFIDDGKKIVYSEADCVVSIVDRGCF